MSETIRRKVDGELHNGGPDYITRTHWSILVALKVSQPDVNMLVLYIMNFRKETIFSKKDLFFIIHFFALFEGLILWTMCSLN